MEKLESIKSFKRRYLNKTEMKNLKGGDSLPVQISLGDRTGSGEACAYEIYGYGYAPYNQCYSWEYDTQLPDGGIQRHNVMAVNSPC